VSEFFNGTSARKKPYSMSYSLGVFWRHLMGCINSRLTCLLTQFWFWSNIQQASYGQKITVLVALLRYHTKFRI